MPHCRYVLPAVLAVASLVPLPCPAQAGQPRPPRTLTVVAHEDAPVVHAARRSGDVRIDGRMDEAAWQRATPFTNFIQYNPTEGEPASERTEARVLVDDEAIYVGVRLYDRDPSKIQANLARRDEFMEGDQITVTLDSYHSHLSAFVFRLSALGARRDAVNMGGDWMDQDNSWDAVWDGSTSIDSLGWTAEFRIPLSQLRYDPRNPEQVWGIQIEREIPRNRELSLLSYTPKTAQQGVNRFGHLVGLGRLP